MVIETTVMFIFRQTSVSRSNILSEIKLQISLAYGILQIIQLLFGVGLMSPMSQAPGVNGATK